MKRAYIVLIITANLFSFSLRGQSPPRSLTAWLPNVLVDGRLAEWEEEQMAFDKEAQLFYQIANNTDYLFLGISTVNVGKVNMGGLFLEIYTDLNNHPGKKQTIFYPISGGKMSDSYSKIKVAGFPEIQDSILSIYNPYGIETAFYKDEKQNTLSMEYAIPLSLLTTVKDGKGFYFNLVMPGVKVSKAVFAALSNPATQPIGQRLTLQERKEMLDLYVENKLSGYYTWAVYP